MKINTLHGILVIIILQCTTTLCAKDYLIPYLKIDKWGYADPQGKIIIEPKFDSLSRFYNDLVEVYIDGKMGVINRSGEYVIQPNYDQLYWRRSNNGNAKELIAAKNGYYGVIDNNENELIPFKYKIRTNQTVFHYKLKNDTISFYTDRGQIFKFDEKHRLINNPSTIIEEGETTRQLNTKFNKYPRFRLLQANEKYGLSIALQNYNPNTLAYNNYDITIEPKYDDINLIDTNHNVIYVKEQNKWGAINEQSEIIIPIQYQAIELIKSEHFFVQKDNNWGAVKVNGNNIQQLLPTKYEAIEKSHDNWNSNYIVTLRGERHYIFTSNPYIEIPLREYETKWISSFGSFQVVEVITKSGKTAYIGENGTYFFEE